MTPKEAKLREYWWVARQVRGHEVPNPLHWMTSAKFLLRIMNTDPGPLGARAKELLGVPSYD